MSRRINISKRYFMLIVLFFAITLSIVFTIKSFAYANDNSKVSQNKLYKSVTIYCGDSIETIAEEYVSNGYTSKNSFINEICHINHISSSSKLIAGNYLIIPYYEVSNI